MLFDLCLVCLLSLSFASVLYFERKALKKKLEKSKKEVKDNDGR